MMNIPVFYGVLITLLLISIWIGKQSRRNQHQHSYFLSNRQVGVIPLILTFLAGQFGGGAILGGAEAAFQYGWQAIYYALGIALGLFALSLGLGSKFRQMQVVTIPEIFSLRYGANKLRFGAAVILAVSMFFILLALGVATRKYFYALGVTNDWWFLGFWLVLIFYTSNGGLAAVVKTDIVKISFVLITFVLVSWVIFVNDDGQLWQLLIGGNDNSAQNLVATSAPALVANSSAAPTLPWSSWLFMPMLFTIIGQDMGQRCFAAKTPRTVAIATGVAGILLVISSLFPVFLGIVAARLGMQFAGASVLIKLIEQLTSPVFASLFAAAVLMAILSTADSVLCSISANLNYDIFYQQQKQNINLAKIVTMLVGFSAILLSFYADGIIGIMVQAYGLSVCTLFVPIVMAVLAKQPNAVAAAAAFWSGMLAYVGFSWWYPVTALELICVGLAFIVYMVVAVVVARIKTASISLST